MWRELYTANNVLVLYVNQTYIAHPGLPYNFVVMMICKDDEKVQMWILWSHS